MRLLKITVRILTLSGFRQQMRWLITTNNYWLTDYWQNVRKRVNSTTTLFPGYQRVYFVFVAKLRLRSCSRSRLFRLQSQLRHPHTHKKTPLAPRATILLTYPSFQNLSLPHFFQILDFIEILSKNLYVSSICIFGMILFQFWSYSGISEEFLKSKMADPT